MTMPCIHDVGMYTKGMPCIHDMGMPYIHDMCLQAALRDDDAVSGPASSAAPPPSTAAGINQHTHTYTHT